MDVKSPLLVAYTRNLQTTSARIGRQNQPAEANAGYSPQIYAPEDIVDISELDPAAEIAGEAITVNLRSPNYEDAGFIAVPVRGSIIDTWA